MQILIVGSGGREHAMAWKAAQGAGVDHVYVAPGNAGCELENNVSTIAIDSDDQQGLLEFARKQSIDLTIVGPEVPLVAGLVDFFQAAGLRIFGPSAKAARLEGSKSFSKEFLQRNNIPTASYAVFHEVDKAVDYIESVGVPIVVKADGLAAGKGVIVATTLKQAFAAVHDMLAENAFGEAGNKVVIEEFLQGEEASFICMVDGENAVAMATSQDHKARDDGDTGPNTGGMGAYSPAAVVTDKVHAHIMRDIVEPTVAAMAAEGAPFTGFLYTGVMIDGEGKARVIEFNVRLGDPETQPLMMRLESDLVALCQAALEKRLHKTELQWKSQYTLGVVMAAGGYPASYTKGAVISGLESADNDLCKVFHAGTALHDEQVVTAGGRVLCVTALGDDVVSAQRIAYESVNKINWQGVYYRRDIGHRAVAREASS